MGWLCPEKIFSVTNTMVPVTKTMVSASQTILSKAENIFSVTNTMVSALQMILSKAAIIFSVTNTMVSASQIILSKTNTMVSPTPTMVSEAKTMVTVTQKMLSVAFTMFFATEQIASAQTQWSIQHRLRSFGSPLSKQSFANPKLVFFGASPLASELRRKIDHGIRTRLGAGLSAAVRSIGTDQPHLHPICAIGSLSSEDLWTLTFPDVFSGCPHMLRSRAGRSAARNLQSCQNRGKQ